MALRMPARIDRGRPLGTSQIFHATVLAASCSPSGFPMGKENDLPEAATESAKASDDSLGRKLEFGGRKWIFVAFEGEPGRLQSIAFENKKLSAMGSIKGRKILPEDDLKRIMTVNLPGSYRKLVITEPDDPKSIQEAFVIHGVTVNHFGTGKSKDNDFRSGYAPLDQKVDISWKRELPEDQEKAWTETIRIFKQLEDSPNFKLLPLWVSDTLVLPAILDARQCVIATTERVPSSEELSTDVSEMVTRWWVRVGRAEKLLDIDFVQSKFNEWIDKDQFKLLKPGVFSSDYFLELQELKESDVVSCQSNRDKLEVKNSESESTITVTRASEGYLETNF